MSGLLHLQRLCLARCALGELPLGVYTCTGLRQLDLSSNSIIEVHMSFIVCILLLQSSGLPFSAGQPSGIGKERAARGAQQEDGGVYNDEPIEG